VSLVLEARPGAADLPAPSEVGAQLARAFPAHVHVGQAAAAHGARRPLGIGAREAGDAHVWVYSNPRTLALVRLDIEARRLLLSVPSLAPIHLPEELAALAGVARRGWGLRGERASAFLERWRVARKAAERAARADASVVDQAALRRYLAFQAAAPRLRAAQAAKRTAPRVGDTFFLRRRGERRVFTAATCPKPTWVMVPPVERLVLFKNPDFRFGGARAGVERAPVIATQDWLAALRPWLDRPSSGAGAWRLNEGAVLAEKGPFEAFEAVWAEARQAPRFAEFDVLDTPDFIDRPLPAEASGSRNRRG
jgi:hypothetical protein